MSSVEVFVVGVDDSPGSRLALEYAAAEAVLRGAVLRVVSTFESSGMFGARYGVPIPVSDEQITKNIEAETEALVNEVVRTLPEPPRLEVVVRVGSAGAVLTAESSTADLLVVGHQGRGAIASTLLGSVGMHCVLHAHCPVTVVRPRTNRDSEAMPAEKTAADSRRAID